MQTPLDPTGLFAVLNLYKPIGPTSHDMIYKVRRVFGLKKVGHLGTLDPAAEGVLPVCIGQATRLIEYFPTDKRYLAEITLGIRTTTLDKEGDITTTMPCPPLSASLLKSILLRFIGTFEQEVPLHSAKHVNGKKLYEYAHAGKQPEGPLPTKQVTIHALTVHSIEQADTPHPKLIVEVHCGTGTYIRALARDIGEALGCGGHLSHLVRTAHGRFQHTDAVPLDTLQESASPQTFLTDPVQYLQMPIRSITSEEDRNRLCHGMPLSFNRLHGDFDTPLEDNQTCLVLFRQEPVCIAKAEKELLKPGKVFQAPSALATPLHQY